MQRTVWLSIFLLAAAVPASAQSRRDRDQDYESSIDTTFAFDRRGTITLGVQSGDLHIEDVGDVVDLGSLSGDIVARGITGNIEVRAVSGDLTLSDVKGDVDATSVSGDIELRGVTARYVRAKSTSGDINFDGSIDTTGRYELGSHSGSVYLSIPQNTGAVLTVSTYNGSIESDFPITLKPGEHGIG